MSKKLFIHINQHRIRANAKEGTNEPVITVKSYSDNRYGHEVDILDSAGKIVATVVYRPEKPLSCGAKVWVECRTEVVVR